MSDNRVANRYAKSLFLSATQKGIVDIIAEDAESILNLAKESRPFDVMLKSPVVGNEKKYKIISELFKGGLNPHTMNYINMVLEKRRDIILELSLQKYLDMVQEQKGIVSAIVTTASVVSNATMENIKAYITKHLGKEVSITSKIDERLIGGFVIQYDDKLIDASVASKLRNVRKQLLSSN